MSATIMRAPSHMLLTGLAFSAILLSAGATYVRSSELAYAVWGRLHLAPVATFLSPHDATLEEAIGNYYFSPTHYDIRAAERHFEKAVSIDPTVPLAHYQLGRIYFIQGRFLSALDELNTQLAQHPDFTRAYYMLGLVHAYKQDFAGAVKAFQAFLAWKPTSWAANNDLAWVYFTEGDYTHALSQADAGLTSNPGNAWLLTMRGVALLNLGRKAEAKEALASALEGVQKMTPTDWSVAYPGNNPNIAKEGLAEMQQAIEKNLALAQ